MEIVIKKCTVEMVEDLNYICRKTFAETFAEQNSEEDMEKYLNETYAPERLKEEILNENSLTFLAYEGEKVIGYLKLNRGDAQTEQELEDSLEIQRIYMAKEAKGKGVGSQFIKLAEQCAKEWSLKRIWLGVWEHNDAALHFYKSKGFECFSKHVFVLGEDEQTDLMMKKELV